MEDTRFETLKHCVFLSVADSRMPKLESYGNSTCPKIHLGTKVTIPKLAEAVPVESEWSEAEIHTILMTRNFILLTF
ncbi:hypothetical protein GCM10007096_27680 [Pullulanibacillus pueri]|uniref:Uncharacterized protein n=1 Tax=Pullulanibacillus pueri TaxID=1437324 RepID=A0A8J2ZXN1_9BACL|nr:hypothetical protein GCM10007096_27680 [Pullulanibacillus pueri]